tara:strand:- start:15450 stop:15629 length:180 start_codon:yes stop_codon:yes gene_type:complete
MTEEDKDKLMKVEPMTALQVQELIIGSAEKMTLLNVFNTLMQENTHLKKELEKLKNDKS